MKWLHRPRKRQTEELVAAACNLVHAQEGVRSVHIVAASRPTYRQFRRYRQVARRDHVALTVDRAGVITIRHAER